MSYHWIMLITWFWHIIRKSNVKDIASSHRPESKMSNIHQKHSQTPNFFGGLFFFCVRFEPNYLLYDIFHIFWGIIEKNEWKYVSEKKKIEIDFPSVGLVYAKIRFIMIFEKLFYFLFWKYRKLPLKWYQIHWCRIIFWVGIS